MKSKIPFPQADNVYKLLIYLFELNDKEVPIELQSMSIENMVPRQESYYKSALEYLGLIEGQKITDEGLYVVNSTVPVMLRLLALSILKHEPFSIYYHFRNDQQIQNYLMVQEGLSESTANRRLQTVISWVRWVDQITKRGINYG
jgi:hypothetical protein